MSLLTVKNVGKVFRNYHSELQRFAGWFGVSSKAKEEHWVLRHVSFDIYPGQAVGIIGVNGAGKSTLLKIITGTLQATEGHVQVNGRIASILELGMGFDHELTGRQNVIHTGGMMGFSPEQIRQALPAIEAFAEIGDYFGQPVRSYSSGMQMRVAFAVATAYRPEILIVDEALSVGDAYFQHKSFARIREFQEQGTSLLIVSHDRGAIQCLCEHAILLDKGLKIKEGKPEVVFDYYTALISEKEDSTIQQKFSGERVETLSGSGEATFEDITLFDSNGRNTEMVKVGEPTKVEFRVKVNEDIKSLVLGFGIKDRLGQMMFTTNTWHTNQYVQDLQAGETYLFSVSFIANLGIGSYSVHASLVSAESQVSKSDEHYDWRDGVLVFNVINVDKEVFGGCMWNKMHFRVEKQTDKMKQVTASLEVE